jgi:hypothetical protein
VRLFTASNAACARTSRRSQRDQGVRAKCSAYPERVLRHEDQGEVAKKIQTTQLVEMDKRAGVADDLGLALSHLRAIPIDVLANELLHQ